MNRDIRLARTMVDVSWIRVLVRPETSLTGYVPSVPSGVVPSGVRFRGVPSKHLFTPISSGHTGRAGPGSISTKEIYASHYGRIEDAVPGGERLNTQLYFRSVGRFDVTQLTRSVVIQIRPQPALGLFHAHPLAFSVVFHLIAIDLAQTEIAGFRVGKVQAAYA